MESLVVQVMDSSSLPILFLAISAVAVTRACDSSASEKTRGICRTLICPSAAQVPVGGTGKRYFLAPSESAILSQPGPVLWVAHAKAGATRPGTAPGTGARELRGRGPANMQCTSTVSTTSFRAWGPAAQPGCWLAVELPRVVGHLHAICAATRSHASVLCCAVLCCAVM